ncbi:hypothetical protein NHX12_012324 [Muraenolepis orangiensis]|uniref:LEM-like domain-containing protein n=1 Tax=Muraenolepis orangiensis TaxID=630683 RepID=A0A9Q0DFX4_9TELE|nr:hypothetical protein NHX12_012324 [Muraenolepis orangiensis]
MPVFEEDPTRLSKSRLRSDLVAHSVVLPCDSSRKAVYVDLHLKHIDPRHAADFSSDEEDQVFHTIKVNRFSCCEYLGGIDTLLRRQLRTEGTHTGSPPSDSGLLSHGFIDWS